MFLPELVIISIIILFFIFINVVVISMKGSGGEARFFDR